MKRVVVMIGEDNGPLTTVFDIAAGNASVTFDHDIETIRSNPAILGLPGHPTEADFERGGSMTLRWRSGRFVSEWRPSLF